MNKEYYMVEIEKQAGLSAVATKVLTSGVGKAMTGKAGKAALKGAAMSGTAGAVVGAASPVQKNPDGTKGSRLKNAIGGAASGALIGGVASGAGNFLKNNTNLNAYMGNAPMVLRDGTIRVQ